MGSKVKLLPVAHKDLQKARNWYNNQKEHLGDDLKFEIAEQINYISKFPRHFQKVHKDLRQANVKRFPYSIFYLFQEKANLIIIVGIFHNSRDPEIIQQRKESH